MTDNVAPGSDERFYETTLGSLMTLLHFKSRFMPQIFNQIQIRRLGKPLQCSDAVLELTTVDQFVMISWCIVILDQEVIQEQLLSWRYDAFLHYQGVLNCIDRSINDMPMSNATGSHAAPNHNWDTSRQVQILWLELFTAKPLHKCVGLVFKETENAFIAKQDLLPHFKSPAGVLLCTHELVVSQSSMVFCMPCSLSERYPGSGDALLMY